LDSCSVFGYIDCLYSRRAAGGGFDVAATIFRIIAVVVIILGVFIAVFVLPFLSRFLKRANKSMAERARQVRDQVNTSLGGMETAQVQLEAFSAMTGSVKAGMTTAIGAADKAVSLLESRAFQVGLPAVLWFLLLAIALPRGLRRHKPKRAPRRVIPPPSWEAAAIEAEGE
jgi:ABC-type multidrug transport system fused ATPase/permease subunit